MDLSGLRDIQLPIHDIGFFPLAFGWWILIFLPLLIFIFVKLFIYIKKQSIKFHAISELNDIIKNGNKIYKKSVEISLLLKRIAIKKFGNNKIANLHGETWQKFIKEHLTYQDFETIKLISSISYRRPEEISKNQFAKIEKLAKDFIRKVL